MMTLRSGQGTVTGGPHGLGVPTGDRPRDPARSPTARQVTVSTSADPDVAESTAPVREVDHARTIPRPWSAPTAHRGRTSSWSRPHTRRFHSPGAYGAG